MTTRRSIPCSRRFLTAFRRPGRSRIPLQRKVPITVAVRAVVRSALSVGAEVYAIYEGYQGMIDGGDGIRRFGWDDVGSHPGR
jgi:hypothetical protein